MQRLWRLSIAVLGGVWIATTPADEAGDEDEAEIPDLDFLEYLGSWQDSDADWLIVSEWEDDRLPRADGRPEAEADEDD